MNEIYKIRFVNTIRIRKITNSLPIILNFLKKN